MKSWQIFIRSRWIFLIVLTVSTIIGILLALRPTQTPLKIIKINPGDSTIISPDSLSSVEITFSRPINQGEVPQVKLELTPSLNVAKTVYTGTIVRFPISGEVSENTKFSGTIYFGDQNIQQWTFNTAFISGKGLGDPQLYQEIYQRDIARYPLLVFTPYETQDYKVFYSAPLTLTVKVKPETSTSQIVIRSEVIRWIVEHNGDPDVHTILFK